MSDSLPTVVSTAEVQLGSVTLLVHHLSDNQRVIDGDSLVAFLEALADGTLLLSRDDGMKLAKELSA